MNRDCRYAGGMSSLRGRLLREHETFRCMVRIYCRRHHAPAGSGLCPDCESLMRYAARRLEKCPYGADKPTCANCPVHCYKPVQREKARDIMRFAGPRMPWRHPIRALTHVLDRLRDVEHPMQLRRRRYSAGNGSREA
jgi:hypothetical protein